MARQMSILLIEDDVNICESFEKIVENRNDIKIGAKTNSSIEALELVKNKQFDAIIVDLELHYGIGSGLEFLKELEKMEIPVKPIIVVNTNVISDIIYENIHKGIADIIFYKRQKGYSPKNVIDSIVLLRKETIEINKNMEISVEDKQKRITDLINFELDAVGISYKLKGREYIFEGIFYMLNNDIKKEKDFSVFQYLSKKYTLLTSSISRAIQTAINEAWRTSSVEDLRENYTAKINYNTGVPTPTEFIYYYLEKIKKMI